MEIIQENLKRTEIFHQEIGKIIFYFSKNIELLSFDTKEKLIFLVLLKKIISNATAANILIYETKLKEAKIILRSAVETVILLTYLSQFPEKIEDYLYESQVLILLCINVLKMVSLAMLMAIPIQKKNCKKKINYALIH